MEILLSSFYLAFCIWLISRFSFFRLDAIPKTWVMGIFILKVASGIGFWYIYTYYYKVRLEADIYKYFDDSKIMFDAIFQQPYDFLRMILGFDNTARIHDLYYSRMLVWSPRFENGFNFENHTMVRINALFRIFSGGYYQVHNIFVNMLSFSGLLALYKAFENLAKGKQKLLFLGVFLPPVVLFWGSGLIKESLILCFMGFSLYCFRRNSLLMLLFLFLLFSIKAALGVLVLSGLLAWYFSYKVQPLVVLNFVLVALLVFSGFFLSYKMGSFNIFKILSRKQGNFIAVSRGGAYLSGGGRLIYVPYDKIETSITKVSDSLYTLRPGVDYCYFNINKGKDTIFMHNTKDSLPYKLFSLSEPAKQRINIPLLREGPFSFLKNAPLAFVNALIHPDFSESKSNRIMQFMALQNFLLLFLFATALLFMNKQAFNEPAFWFCLFTGIGFYSLFGLINPVLGAMMRYKTCVFPLFMIAFVMLFDMGKFINRIRQKAIFKTKQS